MFGLGNKKTIRIFATMDGEVCTIDKTPDEVFSQRMIGDGFVVFPTCGRVYAPVSGTVVQVANTFHAVTIQTPKKDVILTHIGLDTVKLGGEGFVSHVKAGDVVKHGDLMLEVDLNILNSKGINLASPCILLTEDTMQVNVIEGEAEGGSTLVCQVKKIM